MNFFKKVKIYHIFKTYILPSNQINSFLNVAIKKIITNSDYFKSKKHSINVKINYSYMLVNIKIYCFKISPILPTIKKQLTKDK